MFLLEIIEKDCDFFGISKDNLCNNIILKFSLPFKTFYQTKMIFEKTKYLQFNIQKDNQRLFYELSREAKETTDSELLREIFLSYAILPPFLREMHLFKEKIMFLHSAFKNNKSLRIDTLTGILEGKIKKIIRCSKTNYLKIEIGEEEFYISQIRIIS